MKLKLPTCWSPQGYSPLLFFFLSSHCLLRPLHLLLTISTIWNNLLIFLWQVSYLSYLRLSLQLFSSEEMISSLLWWMWGHSDHDIHHSTDSQGLIALVYCLVNWSFLSHYPMFSLWKSMWQVKENDLSREKRNLFIQEFSCHYSPLKEAPNFSLDSWRNNHSTFKYQQHVGWAECMPYMFISPTWSLKYQWKIFQWNVCMYHLRS